MTSDWTFAIGVDVGGTWIRLAAVNDCGSRCATVRIPIAKLERTPEAFLERVYIESAALRDSDDARTWHHRCVGVGVALPGILDPSNSALLRSVNLPFLEGVPLRSLLQERIGLPVVLTTDAQACCQGEFQAHRPRAACFVHLRFGTGIGCAVARMGRVELLEREGNHHPTLLVVEQGADAFPCRCGLRGCLETIASGWGVTAGDVDRAARGSVQAMINLAVHYEPRAICIGGGLLEHQPVFRFKITELYAAKTCEREWLPRLTDARRGDNAGVLGAAYAALSLA